MQHDAEIEFWIYNNIVSKKLIWHKAKMILKL